jgi:penicillin G amidase
MATPTLASDAPSRGRMLRRILLTVILLLVVGVAAIAFWCRHVAVAALPQVDGTIRVSGLKAPVSVLRDAQGVPHVTAANAEDLFFAQGYVQAQDRLWQMDVSRRWAAGEVSEIFGRAMLAHDREQRILGLKQAAERSLGTFPPEERSRWDAYARGVNAFIESHQQNLPVEFRLLGYRPRPWTALDSLLCGANLAQSLNHYQYVTEILRESVTQSLPPELAADLYPNSSWRDHPPGMVQDGWEFPEAEPDDNEQEEIPPAPPAKKAPRGARQPHRRDISAIDASELDVSEAVAPGSNNWVVSGAHTASGRPMLSNDMHLVNTVPNTWYEMHLTIAAPAPSAAEASPAAASAPAYDVAGVTLPGLPYVIMGHNQRIAWGFTNLGPAVEDVYIEKVNERGEYKAGDGWHGMSRRHEVIHVRQQPDVEMDVLATRHGPVITPLVPGEQRTLALRWALYELPLNVPFFEVNSARNWDEFRTAFSQFNMPSQNVVFADIDGHIGYQATGKIPIRPEGDNGSVPVPGDDDAHEWTGYVAFDDLPRVFDPPSGVIATANGRITADDYPHLLSYEWGPPYRTARIYQVLSAPKKFVPADMLKLQTDVYSAYDKFCGDHFVYAVDHAANATARARQAANAMRGWDGRVTVDSKAAAIVTAARTQLWEMLLADRLGAAPPVVTNQATDAIQPRMAQGWHRYSWFMSSVAMENLLTQRPERWLPAGYQDWNALIVAAVDQSVTDDVRDRPWGARHRIELRHPVLGQLPLIGKFFGTGSHPLAGDGTTVKQIGGLLGPSERFTVDFGDLDQATLNIVTGESGQPLGEHWMDQWKAWYEGTTFTLPFSEGAVKSAAKHTLTLAP